MDEENWSPLVKTETESSLRDNEHQMVQDYRNNLTTKFKNIVPYWKLKDRDYICNVCAVTAFVTYEWETSCCQDCGAAIYAGFCFCVQCALNKKICIECGNDIKVYYHYH